MKQYLDNAKDFNKLDHLDKGIKALGIVQFFGILCLVLGVFGFGLIIGALIGLR